MLVLRNSGFWNLGEELVSVDKFHDLLMEGQAEVFLVVPLGNNFLDLSPLILGQIPES